MKYLYLVTLVVLYGLLACENPSESDNNPPSDHSLNIGGIMHKEGLNNPQENCVSCHGADLKGGSSGISCFDCHGTKW